MFERITAAVEALRRDNGPQTLGLQALGDLSNLSQPQPWLLESLGGRRSAAGRIVTPDSAMRVSAVFACVRVLSQSVAQLPLILYRKTGNGAEPAVDHPLYSVLRNAFNAEMTSQDGREMGMNHLCLRGNSFSQIQRDSLGRAVGLWPMHPDYVVMQRDDATGELEYRYTPLNGKPETFARDEVWRTIGMSFNGVQGVSTLTYARESVGSSMAMEEHGAKLFVNGASVGTVLELPGKAGDDQIASLKGQMKSFEGSQNAHRTLVLEDNMKLSAGKLGMSNVDSQWIEGRRFGIEDICRFFNVPPHKVQELARATFNNIEHLTMDFKNASLMPYMVRIEQTGWRDLLTDNEKRRYFLRHDTSQLDRGDTPSLVNMIASGIANTWLSPNEGRALLGYNPREDGDKYENPNTSSGATKPNQPVPDSAKG